MHSKVWSVAAAVVAAVVATGSARGETSADPVSEAQRLVDRATSKYGDGDFEGALTALKKAEVLAAEHDPQALPSIRFNIARCYEQLERWPEALAAYESYNRLPDDPARKQRAYDAMEQLQGKVYASVTIACDPVGSSVQITGLTEGTPSCPYQNDQVPPGSYALKVTHPGYLESVQLIEVEAGAPQTIQVSLERDPQSVVAGQVAAAAPQRRLRPLPWSLLGVGLVGLGVGVGFNVSAGNNRDLAEEEPPGSAQDQAVSDFERDRAVAIAGYAVGGASLVASVVLFVLQGGFKEVEAQPAAFRPTASGFSVSF